MLWRSTFDEIEFYSFCLIYGNRTYWPDHQEICADGSGTILAQEIAGLHIRCQPTGYVEFIFIRDIYLTPTAINNGFAIIFIRKYIHL